MIRSHGYAIGHFPALTCRQHSVPSFLQLKKEIVPSRSHTLRACQNQIWVEVDFSSKNQNIKAQECPTSSCLRQRLCPQDPSGSCGMGETRKSCSPEAWGLVSISDLLGCPLHKSQPLALTERAEPRGLPSETRVEKSTPMIDYPRHDLIGG